MSYPDAITFGEITFGAAAVAFLIRFGIRSYFREKREHLTRLMEPQEEDTEKEK